jgi:hypothetical protein
VGIACAKGSNGMTGTHEVVINTIRIVGWMLVWYMLGHGCLKLRLYQLIDAELRMRRLLAVEPELTAALECYTEAVARRADL